MTELNFSGPNLFANEIALLKNYNVGGMQIVNSDGMWWKKEEMYGFPSA